MPYNILALIIIFLALAAIVLIIARKFPQIAHLEVEELPEEKTAEKKKKILEERFARNLSKIWKKIVDALGPIEKIWKSLQKKFREAVIETIIRVTEERRARARKKETLTTEKIAEKSDRVDALLAEAENFFEEARYADAEHKFLDAVKIDQRNPQAYRGLGKVYMKNGSYKEAEEVFKFLLKLTSGDDTVYVKLGKNASMAGNMLKAKEYYKKALTMNMQVALRHFEFAEILEALGELKPAYRAYLKAVKLEGDNPRYLDGLLNISIKLGDKAGAEAVYEKLRIVNPENKKLPELRQRIDSMPI